MVKVTDFGLIEKYICVETDRNVWYFALGKKIQCLFAHLGPARHIHVISKATPREPILVPISEIGNCVATLIWKIMKQTFCLFHRTHLS